MDNSFLKHAGAVQIVSAHHEHVSGAIEVLDPVVDEQL